MTLRQNLYVNEGETWSFVYTHLDSSGNAVDLTGYTSAMSIRREYGGSLMAYLTTGADADGGTITLGGATGIITISMTATETGSFISGIDIDSLISGENVANVEPYIFDLEIVDGETVTRVLQGAFLIRRGVTQ